MARRMFNRGSHRSSLWVARRLSTVLGSFVRILVGNRWAALFRLLLACWTSSSLSRHTELSLCWAEVGIHLIRGAGCRWHWLIE